MQRPFRHRDFDWHVSVHVYEKPVKDNEAKIAREEEVSRFDSFNIKYFRNVLFLVKLKGNRSLLSDLFKNYFENTDIL